MGIIAWIVFGFIIGLLARAIMPRQAEHGLHHDHPARGGRLAHRWPGGERHHRRVHAGAARRRVHRQPHRRSDTARDSRGGDAATPSRHLAVEAAGAGGVKGRPRRCPRRRVGPSATARRVTACSARTRRGTLAGGFEVAARGEVASHLAPGRPWLPSSQTWRQVGQFGIFGVRDLWAIIPPSLRPRGNPWPSSSS